jgi:hypothetical protein
MYTTLKVVLDIPVVRRIGSVKAQKPIDCPGRESMITAQEMAKTTQFSTFPFFITMGIYPCHKRFDLLFQLF